MSNSKPKIGFVLTGHIRSNPLGFTQKPNYTILESLNKYVFSDEFKYKYDYDIVISTDSIDIHRAYDYFGTNHLRNIKCTNQLNLEAFYVNKVTKMIHDESLYQELFLQQHDINSYNYAIGLNQIIGQMYRIFDAFNMLDSYKSYDNYDYICKIRLDCIIDENIMESIHKMDNDTDIQMIGSWGAITCIGRPKIMKYYCESVINRMGSYDFTTSNYKFDNFFQTDFSFYLQCRLDKYRWKYTLDMQIMEHMLRYCEEQNLDVNKTIKNGFYSVYVNHPPGSY